ELSSELEKVALESREEWFRKVVARRSAENAVLVLDVPVVPDESIGSRLARIREFLLENPAEFARARGKVFSNSNRIRLHSRPISETTVRWQLSVRIGPKNAVMRQVERGLSRRCRVSQCKSAGPSVVSTRRDPVAPWWNW